MGKIVKAILIDPFACKVTEVDHDASDLQNIYRRISHNTMTVSTFTVAYPLDTFAEGDAIFVDDDGLLKPCDRFFRVAGCAQPLPGKGLVLGSDCRGDPSESRSPVATIRRGTVFFERIAGLGLVRTFTPWSPRHEPVAHQ